MLPLAYFGIESNAFNLVIDLLIVFAVVLYLSLLYWTYADARRRILDPVMIALGVVVSLVPFLGTLIYIILRPPEYLEDVRERELETRAAEARLHGLDYQLCPHCDYRIERDFVRCPSCLRKLKERCVNCAKPLDRAWTICPYCETEVPPELAPRRRTRRRSAASAEEPASGEPATRAGEPATRAGESSARLGEASARPVRGAVTGLDSDLARESVVLSEPPAPDDPPASRPRASGRASRPPGGRPRPSS
jgi:Double zinc ribbon